MAVCVGRVGDHQNFAVWVRFLVQYLALSGKDLSIDLEEIFAFHAVLTGEATHKDSDLDVLESFFSLVGADKGGKKREGTIL